MTNIMKNQSYCPKCHRMYCEGYWNEGVCIADMQFCGEPTADGDIAASYLRVWYEAHRESWYERLGKPWLSFADNLMLGLMAEVRRIKNERQRQEEQRKTLK